MCAASLTRDCVAAPPPLSDCVALEFATMPCARILREAPAFFVVPQPEANLVGATSDCPLSCQFEQTWYQLPTQVAFGSSSPPFSRLPHPSPPSPPHAYPYFPLPHLFLTPRYHPFVYFPSPPLFPPSRFSPPRPCSFPLPCSPPSSPPSPRSLIHRPSFDLSPLPSYLTFSASFSWLSRFHSPLTSRDFFKVASLF